MALGNETIGTRKVDGVEVEVVGFWDDETPDNEYDYFDIFVEGLCINLGEPFYEMPTDEDIRACLEMVGMMAKDCWRFRT